MSQSLARALDAEFRRVAKDEDITMEQLVQEVADLTNYTPRQIYNFRSGKWPIPAPLIPMLCKRFGSRLLINVLDEELKEVPPVPLNCSIEELALNTMREVMNYHLEVITAVKEGLDRIKLNEFNEKTDQIIRRERCLLIALEAEYERVRHGERKQA